MDMMQVIATMVMLVAVMFVGYFCAKLNITGPVFNKQVSPVMMNIFLSATVLHSVINVVPSLSGREICQFIALFFLMMVVSGLLGYVATKIIRVPKAEEGIAICLITYMNTAFVGYPIVEALYGTEAIFYASLSGIPFNLMIYSVGTMTLCGSTTGQKISLKKMLTVPMIVTLVATAIFAFRIPFPAIVEDTITTLSGATTPMSMIIIGTSLGAIPLKKALTNWRVYVLSLVRLVLCPVAVYFLMAPFVTNEMILGIVTVLTATPTAMVLTILCIQYDRDDSFASSGIFVSTILSALTIPFIIWLLLL